MESNLTNLKFVNSREKDSPKFTVLCSLESHIATLDLQRCFFYGSSTLIRNETLNATVSFRKELHQWQLVVGPILFKFMSRWEFTAGNFKRNLVASKPNVVVILHSSSQRVPCRTICDTILERWGACRALTRHATRHFSMVTSVNQREMSEDVIVGC